MKHLKDLTLKEFTEYNDMLNMDEPDIFGIFELFGLDGINMSFDKFNEKWNEIQNMTIIPRGVHKTYTIKGRRFKAELNHLKLSAGQFVDFQSYMRDFKLEEILSVFLIPQYRKWGRWHTHKYNDGYDVIEVQEFLLNNMTVGTAQDLSNFFLTSSVKLLGLMKGFLEKKKYKAMKKNLQLQENNLLG